MILETQPDPNNQLKVLWPDGKIQEFEHVPPHQFLNLEEGAEPKRDSPR